MIVDERDDQIIIQDDITGRIESYPNAPYWRLKLKQFNKERIYHKFGRNVEIQETYDIGIFNLTIEGHTLNVRDVWRDDVARAIIDGDEMQIKQIYAHHQGQGVQSKMVEALLTQFPNRIRVEDEGFIVDDMFKIDRHGSASYRSNMKKFKATGQQQITSDWSFLCIVSKARSKKKVKLPSGEIIEIDPLDEQIIDKILFLLEPNMKDSVFTNQLPDEIKEILKRNDEREYTNKQHKDRAKH